MLRFLVLGILLCFSNAFVITKSTILNQQSLRADNHCLKLRMSVKHEEGLFSRRSHLKGMAGLAIGMFGGALPATADMTLTSIKRAYFRYVPRIESGRDLYVLKLRSVIENSAWEEVLSFFTKQSQAQEDSQKKAYGLDAKLSILDANLVTPMEVWITSFAEKGTSPKQRKLEAKANALRDALEKIRIAAGGNGGAPDKQAAIDAWEEGRQAFNGYIKIANKGLSLQLNQLDTIPDDWKTYEKTAPRPASSFSDSGRAILSHKNDCCCWDATAMDLVCQDTQQYQPDKKVLSFLQMKYY